MKYDYERIPILLKYISNDMLFAIYMNKSINKLGVRSSRIEDIKKNRDILIGNLLKPVNKKSLENWLFQCFITSKKNEDNNPEDNKGEDIFIKLLHLLLDEKYEEFDLYVDSIEFKLSNSGEASSEKIDIESLTEQEKQNEHELESSKRLRRLDDKIKKLQQDLDEKDKQCEDRIQSYTEKISSLNDQIKKLQDDLQKSKQNGRELEKEIKDLEIELEAKNIINKVLKEENNTHVTEIQNLKNEIREINKKEVWVLGDFDYSLIKNKNVDFQIFAVNELESGDSINNEFWFLKYTLTPREQFVANKLLDQISINNKKLIFKNNTQLLEKIEELNKEVSK